VKNIIGFGDFMVSLNPEGYLRFIQANKFDINYTGAEANVLVSLSMMGMPTEFVTRLPKNDISSSGIAHLKKFGVGVKNIAFGGDRMGLLYLEKGAAQRPSKVIYDRKYSSICTVQTGDFNWDKIFADACWFHITGITPALSESTSEVSIEACRAAKSNGLTVSCDLNYRKNLWTPEQARATMERLLEYVDVLVANEEDADKILGIRAANTDVNSGKLDYEGYTDVARQINQKYRVGKIAVTLRTSISASDNEWVAMLYDGGHAYFSKKYMIHIVNRVGAGDSFAAGLIYGMLQGFDAQKTIEFAAAASCLKHSIEMDFNVCTVEEITKLMEGDASGRVQR